MTKEEIIDIMNESFNEKTGHNEAVDDSAFFIEARFNQYKKIVKRKIGSDVFKEIEEEYLRLNGN